MPFFQISDNCLISKMSPGQYPKLLKLIITIFKRILPSFEIQTIHKDLSETLTLKHIKILSTMLFTCLKLLELIQAYFGDDMTIISTNFNYHESSMFDLTRHVLIHVPFFIQLFKVINLTFTKFEKLNLRYVSFGVKLVAKMSINKK